MPKNPFKDNQDFVTKPKRNAFDLSFQNNLTMKLGTLYPVFCKECLPGDSFQIDADFGLKFLPMPFPTQTPMRATMHFFYVRNRNLWKNWMDFYGMTKDGLVHPYIENDDPDFWRTGSLSDYLGVPTTYAGLSGSPDFYPFYSRHLDSVVSDGVSSSLSSVLSIPYYSIMALGWRSVISGSLVTPTFSMNDFLKVDGWPNQLDRYRAGEGDAFDLGHTLSFNVQNSPFACCGVSRAFTTFDSNAIPLFGSTVACSVLLLVSIGDTDYEHSVPGYLCGACAYGNQVDITSHRANLNQLVRQYGRVWLTFVFDPDANIQIGSVKNEPGAGVSYDSSSNSLHDVADVDTINPFSGKNPDIRISALPYRAYEQIYNAYYRNVQNDPFLVNGQPEYNKYGTTYEDGPDSTPYHLFQRNWEMDFLTSALPSPQQGMAPLVGVSALGNIQIDDGDNGIINFQAEVGDDGDTVVGGSWHHPNPSIQARQTMMDLITGGFSINDFRNVNSFQRFVETNMRRGLRYKDVVLGHTGVNVKYDELDMPEFIGGFSRPVTVSQVLQSVDNGDSSPLGSYAGNANCFGGSRHSIQHYCDESGFIMGILCVVPQPSYSQLLPKHFLHHETLDYYFPEFGHLGMQSICYDEVAPIQVKIAQLAGSDIKFTDAFGYQRPWYDLLASVDEVHGQMRTTQRDFLMNRLFDGPPELGHDFLAIDPVQTNNIFVMTNDELDPIQGQLAFRCFVKRAIPRYGIPRLE